MCFKNSYTADCYIASHLSKYTNPDCPNLTEDDDRKMDEEKFQNKICLIGLLIAFGLVLLIIIAIICYCYNKKLYRKFCSIKLTEKKPKKYIIQPENDDQKPKVSYFSRSSDSGVQSDIGSVKDPKEMTMTVKGQIHQEETQQHNFEYPVNDPAQPAPIVNDNAAPIIDLNENPGLPNANDNSVTAYL